MICFPFIVLKVDVKHCINVEKKNTGLVYCVKDNCDAVIGFCAKDEGEFITFTNVRETTFRPHTLYMRHHTTDRKDAQQIIFMELIENGKNCQTLNIPNMLITPLAIPTSLCKSDMPSTSKISEPTIRIAAFASEAFINLDQSNVLNYFKAAIVRDSEENNLGSPKVLSLVSNKSLQKELFESQPLKITNHLNNEVDDYDLSEFLAPRKPISNNIEVVSVDFTDLMNSE